MGHPSNRLAICSYDRIMLRRHSEVQHKAACASQWSLTLALTPTMGAHCLPRKPIAFQGRAHRPPPTCVNPPPTHLVSIARASGQVAQLLLQPLQLRLKCPGGVKMWGGQRTRSFKGSRRRVGAHKVLEWALRELGVDWGRVHRPKGQGSMVNGSGLMTPCAMTHGSVDRRRFARGRRSCWCSL